MERSTCSICYTDLLPDETGLCWSCEEVERQDYNDDMTASEYYGEVLAAQHDYPDIDVYGGNYSEI